MGFKFNPFTGTFDIDATGLTSESDPVFTAWLATNPLSGYVPTSRTLTINGTTYDLTANRSWTITETDPVFGAWLAGSPLSGYVPTSRTLTINGTTYDLTANRSWTVSATPGGSTTQIQYNNAGAFGGMTGFTFDNVSGRATFGAFHYPGVSLDYILTVGQGAFDDLVGSRSHFTCRRDTGCVGIVDNGGLLGYVKSRGTRLDVVASSTDTFPELSLSGSAIFEQSVGDRNRIFLINKYQHALYGGPDTSRSSAIHWASWKSSTDPYFVPLLQSDWELGSDYLQVGENSFYLWNSYYGMMRLLLTDKKFELWQPDNISNPGTPANQRMALFYSDITDGRSLITIGRNVGSYFNEADDYLLSGSIFIGENSGGAIQSGGTNTLVGINSGGNWSGSIGSGNCFYGASTGANMSGSYNICQGYGAGIGAGSSGSNNMLFGTTSGSDLAAATSYTILFDNKNWGTDRATKQNAIIWGVMSGSSAKDQTYAINAEVSVMGLNALCDDDTGEPIFDSNGEMVFMPVLA